MAKRVGIRAPKVTNDRVTKKSNMKNILLILLILIYGKTSAQNIKIVNKSIIFEKVYTTTTTNMSDFLTRNLSGVKNTVDFFKGDGYYTLRFQDAAIDYKRYGGKFSNTLLWLNHPFFANVNVQWKEGRYKVTVSNMYVFVRGGLGKNEFENFLIKRGQLGGAKITNQALFYIDSWLSETFSFTETSNDTNW